MMAPFEDATVELSVGQLSGIVDTESGSHVILRTSAEVAPRYRASHILIKHEGSRRKASWKDPEGNQIKRRARDDAVASLQGFLAVLTPLSGGERMQKFATLASAESDCGSAQEGGDLDWFESGQMMPPFEMATAALQLGDLSGVVDTDSGTHIVMRTG